MREKAYTIRIEILACAFARMPLMSGFAPTPKEVTHATPHCFLLIEWLLIPGTAALHSTWQCQRKKLRGGLFKHWQRRTQTTVFNGQANHRGIPFQITWACMIVQEPDLNKPWSMHSHMYTVLRMLLRFNFVLLDTSTMECFRAMALIPSSLAQAVAKTAACSKCAICTHCEKFEPVPIHACSCMIMHEDHDRDHK